MMHRRQLLLAGLSLPWVPLSAQAAGLRTPPLFSTAEPGTAPPAGWRNILIPKKERANQIQLIDDGGQTVLRVDSNDSVSSWATELDADAQATPWLQWRWKVSRALPGSDLQAKAGDDYAARLYVFFALPDSQLSLSDRLKIKAAKLVYGFDIPSAALCYVWGSRQAEGATGWSPHSDRVRMVVLDSGEARARQWREHRRDLRRDWAAAFPGPLPRVSGIAIGADTDATHEQVQAWFGDIRLIA